MTIIQPHIAHHFNRVIAFLIIALLGEALMLVMFYNHFVNLQHAITSGHEALRTAQMENAELKDAIFTLLDTQHLRSLAESKGFIEERHPHYLEPQPQVSLAQ